MNVTELIEYLKNFDGDLSVGMVDDYGVFAPVDKRSFNVSKAYENYPGSFGTDNVPRRISVLGISVPFDFSSGVVRFGK